MAEFHPYCPGCRYDLAGLPVNVCPECGAGFDPEALRREWDQRGAGLRQAISPHWLLGVAMALCWPCVGPLLGTSSHDERAFAFVFGSIAVALLAWWACLKREALAWSNPWPALWLIIPFSITWTNWRGNIYFLGPQTWLSVAVLVAILAPWADAPRRTWALPMLLVGLIPAAPGLCLTLAGIDGLLHGVTWTAFADPRPGQVHDQYPLNSREALVLGVPVLAASLACIGLAVIVDWRRRRRERAACSRSASPGSSPRSGT